MSRLPLRDPHAQTAAERAERAAWLQKLLGPVSEWPEEWLAEWNERAAIVEFEGGLSRESAEQEAAEMLCAQWLEKGP